ILVVRLAPHVGRNLTDSRQLETVRDRVVVRESAGKHRCGREVNFVPQANIQRELLRYRPFVLNVSKQSFLPDGGKRAWQVPSILVRQVQQETGKSICES